MDSCTITSIRNVLAVFVVGMAAWGLWNFHAQVTCADREDDKKECVTRSFVMTAGIAVAVFALTTLIIMNESRKMVPSTTDLVQNLT